MPNWTLVFYTNARGDRPVEQYIDTLQPSEAVRVVQALELLAEFGTRLRMPHVRAMEGSDLWELRIRARGNQHRIFYVAIAGREMLLLHAFMKKGQRTPRRELRTAEQRLREHRSR